LFDFPSENRVEGLSHTEEEGMPDYWVKITEREEEEIQHHHYLVTAKSDVEARRLALRFVERFFDDDENPEQIDNGFSFYNRAIDVQISDIKETTRERFKDFLLKIHTIG
jgi:hypothetical protein